MPPYYAKKQGREPTAGCVFSNALIGERIDSERGICWRYSLSLRQSWP